MDLVASVKMAQTAARFVEAARWRRPSLSWT
jgi:hypothetical protein